MIHHIEESQISEEIVRNSSKLMVVDFYADWCVPCQMLTPILHEVDKKYKDIEIYKINIDESPNANVLHGITSVPTLLFFKDGEEIERKVGLMSIEKIAKVLDELK